MSMGTAMLSRINFLNILLNNVHRCTIGVTIVVISSALVLSGCGDNKTVVELPRPHNRVLDIAWATSELNPLPTYITASSDGKLLWAVGRHGLLLRSADVGVHWEQIKSNTQDNLTSIAFADDLNGWSVGDGIIIATHDGGKTWDKVGLSEIETLPGFAGVAAKANWIVAVGSSSAIVMSQDGGKTWSAVNLEQSKGIVTDFNAVTLVEDKGALHAWAVGLNGVIVEYSPETNEWTERYNDSYLENVHDVDLDSISMLPTGSGVAVGEPGLLLSTSDHGKTWHQVDVNSWATSAERIISVQFYNDKDFWAMTDQGSLYDSDGYTANTKASSATSFIDNVYLSPDHKNVFLISSDGRMYRSENAGSTWQATKWPSPGRIAGMISRAGSSVAVLSRSGSIYHAADGDMADGDAKWVAQEFSSPERFQVVAFDDKGARGLAIGRAQTWVTTDGLGNWGSIKISSEGLRAAAVAPSGNVGALVGGSGKILISRDGLVSWSQVPSIGLPAAEAQKLNIVGVDFADDKVAWAIGHPESPALEKTILLHSEDGGLTWKNVALPPEWRSVTFWTVKTPDPRAIWLGGGRTPFKGVIISTVDGGSSWHETKDLKIHEIHGLSLPGDGATAYSVDKLGHLFRGEVVNRSPYVTSFSQTTSSSLGGPPIVIDVGVDDDANPENIQIIEVEFREGVSWQKIQNLQVSSVRPRLRQFTWDPGSTSHRVNPGGTIHYRVTIADNSLQAAPVEIPSEFEYAPWCSRHQSVCYGGFIGGAAVLAYIAVCGTLLLLSPLSLLALYRLPLRELASIPGGVSGTLLKILVEGTLLDWLATRRRTRSAWLREYRNNCRADEGLQPIIRQKYMLEQDVRDVWVEHFRAGRVFLMELDEKVRREYLTAEQVLDAWVANKVEQARVAFDKIATVAARRTYVGAGLRIGDGDTVQTLLNPKGAELGRLIPQGRSAVEIVGVGGSGKSTLACQIGRWAMEQTPGEGLFPHVAIPLLLEEEIVNLHESCTRLLRRMLGDNVDITEEITRAVVRHRRLIVEVDALSERTIATQSYVKDIFALDRDVGLIIVTSRTYLDLAPVNVLQIRPEPIEGPQLIPFIYEYMAKIDANRLFTQRQQLELGDRILALSERGGKRSPVTPLLVKLVVDNAIDLAKRGIGLTSLPVSVAETIVEYIRRTNPGSVGTPGFISSEHLIEVARAPGRKCLEPDWVPRDFRRDNAERDLTAESITDAGAAIARLIQNGVIAERSTGGIGMIRFVLDSVAEYLAGLYWALKCGADVDLWTELLSRLDEDVNARDAQGFLNAFLEIIIEYRSDFQIPADVEIRLRAIVRKAAAS